VRANAQATLNSANATLGAVQTQQQNDANVIAATAEIARANAQATLNSAGSTQSAALTQDAIRQTQMADLATTGAQAIVNQQYKDELAAGTQTAVANNLYASPIRCRDIPTVCPPTRRATAETHHIRVDVVPSNVHCAIGGLGPLGSLAPTKDPASQFAYSRKSC
jgi:hypothetical protein